jgi:hypothetical protein
MGVLHRSGQCWVQCSMGFEGVAWRGRLGGVGSEDMGMGGMEGSGSSMEGFVWLEVRAETGWEYRTCVV